MVAYATDDAWLELIIPEPCHLQVCLFATFCQSSEPQDKQEFSYNSFNPGRDFGPLDLCATVTYCRWVDALIQTHTQNALVHITTERPECWSSLGWKPAETSRLVVLVDLAGVVCLEESCFCHMSFVLVIDKN